MSAIFLGKEEMAEQPAKIQDPATEPLAPHRSNEQGREGTASILLGKSGPPSVIYVPMGGGSSSFKGFNDTDDLLSASDYEGDFLSQEAVDKISSAITSDHGDWVTNSIKAFKAAYDYYLKEGEKTIGRNFLVVTFDSPGELPSLIAERDGIPLYVAESFRPIEANFEAKTFAAVINGAKVGRLGRGEWVRIPQPPVSTASASKIARSLGAGGPTDRDPTADEPAFDEPDSEGTRDSDASEEGGKNDF